MALQEERNEQSLRRWQARLVRERQTLSASVEEALSDTSAHEVHLPEGVDEQGEGGLVRPVLSLQSRPLPAVRPNGSRPGETSSLLAISSTVTGEMQLAQQGNMLSRIAQRLSSLLPAISAPEHVPVPAQRSEPALSPQSQPQAVPLPAPQREQQTDRVAHARRQTMIMPRVVLQPVEEERALPPPESRVAKFDPPVDEAARNLVAPPLPLPPQLQAIERGSGLFEIGQSEVMVANSCVNANSLVLVTLTSNPGPVVVQYVSLHVEVGFTVHLTAPATVKTLFNYIVL